MACVRNIGPAPMRDLQPAFTETPPPPPVGARHWLVPCCSFLVCQGYSNFLGISISQTILLLSSPVATQKLSCILVSVLQYSDRCLPAKSSTAPALQHRGMKFQRTTLTPFQKGMPHMVLYGAQRGTFECGPYRGCVCGTGKPSHRTPSEKWPNSRPCYLYIYPSPSSDPKHSLDNEPWVLGPDEFDIFPIYGSWRRQGPSCACTLNASHGHMLFLNGITGLWNLLLHQPQLRFLYSNSPDPPTSTRPHHLVH